MMFKKIFVLILFFVFTAINIYATDDCSDVTCPDGWNSGETGWVRMQVKKDPDPAYCVVKVCYCYDFSEDEGPNFYMKKIIYVDSTCILPNNPIDPEVFKISLISELIRLHQNQINLIFCPDYSGYYSVELFTSFCYADYYYQNDPMSIPCDGDGYCVQNYNYCWDNTKSPWELKVEKNGTPMIYTSSECILPIGISADPNYEIIHPCITWCY